MGNQEINKQGIRKFGNQAIRTPDNQEKNPYESLWNHYEISMESLLNLYGISIESLRNRYRISMEHQKSQRNPDEILYRLNIDSM